MVNGGEIAAEDPTDAPIKRAGTSDRMQKKLSRRMSVVIRDATETKRAVKAGLQKVITERKEAAEMVQSKAQSTDPGEAVPHSLLALIETIKKAAEWAVDQPTEDKDGATEAALLDLSIKRNIFTACAQIEQTSRPLAKLVEEKKLRIVPALYTLSTGEVEFLPEEPVQALLEPQGIEGQRQSPSEEHQSPSLDGGSLRFASLIVFAGIAATICGVMARRRLG